MEKEKGIYQRNEGRWEARFKVGTDGNGRAKYRSIYAQTRDEVIARRDEILGIHSKPKRVRVGPMKLNLLILGAGTHGRDIYEIAQSLHVFKDIKFLDDEAEGENIIGKCADVSEFRNEYPCAFIAIGDNEIRKKYAELLHENDFLIPSIVSPAANISSKAKIGEGVAILPQVTVSEAQIGDFCILSSNSLVNGGAKVGDFTHIGCAGIILKGKDVPELFHILDGTIY